MGINLMTRKMTKSEAKELLKQWEKGNFSDTQLFKRLGVETREDDPAPGAYRHEGRTRLVTQDGHVHWLSPGGNLVTGYLADYSDDFTGFEPVVENVASLPAEKRLTSSELSQLRSWEKLSKHRVFDGTQWGEGSWVNRMMKKLDTAYFPHVPMA